MKSFVFSVGFFLLGLCVLDRSVGWALDRIYAQVKTGESSGGLVNLALAQKDAQIIFFGNSRCRHQVVPEVIMQTFPVKVHNAGAIGQNIQYHHALLQLLLAEKTSAQVLVRIIDHRELHLNGMGGANKMSPLYGRLPGVDALLEEGERWNKLKYLSSTYRYNSMVLPILRNYFDPELGEEDGYRPMQGNNVVTDPAKANPIPALPDPLPIDPAREALILDFTTRAQAAGIQVVAALSPLWRLPNPLPPEETALLQHYEGLLQKQGVPLLKVDEAHYPELNNPKLYWDNEHLNDEGARLYSNLLAARLQEVITLR